MVSHRVPTVRAAAERSRRLSLLKARSIRVQVRAVGRQVEQLRARRLDGLAHALDLVAAEVVHDDHVACAESWREHLLDVGAEGAVERQRA